MTHCTESYWLLSLEELQNEKHEKLFSFSRKHVILGLTPGLGYLYLIMFSKQDREEENIKCIMEKLPFLFFSIEKTQHCLFYVCFPFLLELSNKEAFSVGSNDRVFIFLNIFRYFTPTQNWLEYIIPLYPILWIIAISLTAITSL